MTSAAGILTLWERVADLSPPLRALALAEAAGGEPEVLRDRPVGETHAWLLRLRESWLGSRMEATVCCPGCGERAELALDTAELRALGDARAPLRQAGARPPTPADLAAASVSADPERELRQRCLGALLTGEQEPSAALVAEVEEALSRADPIAEVVVRLRCPACGTAYDADVDLAAHVAAELDALAQRLLHEVDVLARAYGWTEHEVLALPAARRAAYLRLVTEGAP